MPPADTISEHSPGSPHGPFASLRRKLPKSEVIRYLFVGGFNTVFGLALYALFVHLFGKMVPTKLTWLTADLAFAASTPVGITVAFLCYKHFVFHTKGNYLKEWLRCFAVYGVSFIVGFVIVVPLATQLMTAVLHNRTQAPYAAGIVNSAITAIYSYFGHKKFSFKQ
jgi:putative flippase GtrA